MLPQSIIDAYEEERARFDGYKGPLFKVATQEILLEQMGRKMEAAVIDRVEKSWRESEDFTIKKP